MSDSGAVLEAVSAGVITAKQDPVETSTKIMINFSVSTFIPYSCSKLVLLRMEEYQKRRGIVTKQDPVRPFQDRPSLISALAPL